MKAIASARRFAGVLALAMLVAAISAVPASAGHNPADVDVEVGACGETTVTATITDPAGTHRVSNMRLVVDVDGAAQNVIVPIDGSSVSLAAGPFYGQSVETETVSWRVFGGGERSYDDPLWNGFGEPGFGADVGEYAEEVGTFNWVVAGTEDPNPFTTWNEVEVDTCAITEEMCKDSGYADFGFRNQGQCIRFVNTGKDSR